MKTSTNQTNKSMKTRQVESATVTLQVFRAFKVIFFAVVHDEATYLSFRFYVQDFVVLVRKFMDEMAVRYEVRGHLSKSAECLGEDPKTIWNATKKDLGYCENDLNG